MLGLRRTHSVAHCCMSRCVDFSSGHFNHLSVEPKSRQTRDPLQRAKIDNAGRSSTRRYKNLGTDAIFASLHKRNTTVCTEPVFSVQINTHPCVCLVVSYFGFAVHSLRFCHFRLYPVVIGNGRNLQSDAVISGYHVPKGVSSLQWPQRN